MPAHLAGQQRAGLAHLGLDQRMAGLPHGGLAAGLGDGAGHMAAALHVVDDLGARVARQHIAREQDELPVRPDDLAGFADHAQAVAIAIEGQADLAVRIAQAIDQVLQVLRIGRVRMVPRKGAVHLAEQLGDLAAQRAEQGWGDRAGHAVATIDGDLHRPGQPDVAHHARGVAGLHLHLRAPAGMGRAFYRPPHGVTQRGDAVPVERSAIQHELEAVVVGRIVAAGDRDARAGIHQPRGEIQHGRGRHADVDHMQAGGAQAGLQRGRQLHAAQPAVARHHHRARAQLQRLHARRHAQAVGKARVDLLGHRATDVVGLENRIKDVRSVPAKVPCMSVSSGWRHLGPFCLKSP